MQTNTQRERTLPPCPPSWRRDVDCVDRDLQREIARENFKYCSVSVGIKGLEPSAPKTLVALFGCRSIAGSASGQRYSDEQEVLNCAVLYAERYNRRLTQHLLRSSHPQMQEIRDTTLNIIQRLEKANPIEEAKEMLDVNRAMPTLYAVDNGDKVEIPHLKKRGDYALVTIFMPVLERSTKARFDVVYQDYILPYNAYVVKNKR
jgi:hypothetical protein